MNDRLRVFGAWPARKESIDACADRLHRFLVELAACDPVFSKWYKLGTSRRSAARHEIDFSSRTVLVDMLERGRHRKDVGNEIMEELGFRVGMWNGAQEGRTAGLSIGCGMYSTLRGIGVNAVGIDLPEQLGDLQRTDRMSHVLAVIARYWAPEWGGVYSQRCREVRQLSIERLFVDWMFYASKALIPNPHVPAPSVIHPVDDIGSVIIVQPEPVDVDNPEHMQHVKAVETSLGLTH